MTFLLNLHNAYFFAMNAMIVGMGLFYGGIAQVIAGIMEWKKGNTFGTTAFISYGFFWLSLVSILLLPKIGIAAAPDSLAMSMYLLVWGIFSLCLFIGTLKLSAALQFVFGTLVLLFALLSLGDYTGNHMITVAAGYEGLICGSAAIYTGIAQVLNEVYGKTLLPLG